MSDASLFNRLCWTLGAATLVYLVGGAAFTLLRGVYRWYLRPRKNLQRYGEWAIVTGATDGIGKAYAFELARSGLNVMLISRTLSKLQAVAEELKVKYPGGNFRVLDVDFNSTDPKTYDRIAQSVRDLQVGILVNNVGISYDFPEYFTDVPAERIQQLVDLNVVAMTKMTAVVLPGMAQRGCGAIVNLASGSGLRPTPLLSVYGATKAYMDHCSRALALEYAGKIHFQSVTPFFVSSNMSKMKPSFTTPSPANFARQAVNQLGYEDHTMGCMAHAVMQTLMDLFPNWLVDGQVLKLHKSIRVRALARKNKAQ